MPQWSERGFKVLPENCVWPCVQGFSQNGVEGVIKRLGLRDESENLDLGSNVK